MIPNVSADTKVIINKIIMIIDLTEFLSNTRM